MTGLTDEDRLADLLLQWEELFEQGKDIPVEELCRDCPDMIPAMVERIAALKRMTWVNKQSQEAGKAGGGGPASGAVADRTVAISLHPGAEPIPGLRLIQRLGNGAYGEVWSAQYEIQSENNTPFVAIKFFYGHYDAKNREIEGLTKIEKISHPSLLEIISLLRVMNARTTALCLVTELADYSIESVFRRLRQGFTIQCLCDYALFLLGDVAEALDFIQAHHKLAHLDIKPANLLMVSGKCKLADFGTVRQLVHGIKDGVVLAAPLEPDSDVMTTVSYKSFQDVPWANAIFRGATLFSFTGGFTPCYAPPEAFQGKISRSFDQYSLALTFCELVTGTIPFAGNGYRQVKERLSGKVEMGSLPQILGPIIGRALSPNSEERYSSCQEFLSAMRMALPLGTENANIQGAEAKLRDIIACCAANAT